MTDTTGRRDWHSGGSPSLADRLIDGTVRFFIAEPVSASVVVLFVVGGLTNSGLAAFTGWAIALLFASHLRRRYERDL